MRWRPGRASPVSPPSGGGPGRSPADTVSQRRRSRLRWGIHILPSEPRPSPREPDRPLGEEAGNPLTPRGSEPPGAERATVDPSRGNGAAMRSQVEAGVCVLNFAGWKCAYNADLSFYSELSEYRVVFNHSRGINRSCNSLFHPQVTEDPEWSRAWGRGLGGSWPSASQSEESARAWR